MSRKTRRNASKNDAQNLTLRAAIRRLTSARMGLSGLALGSMAFSGQVYAAAPDSNATDSDLTEIVVTGIRASLQKSLDIKKESDGIVDAISAEDIGKFPDSNLAAAMERVPGVTVTRAATTLTGTGGTSTTGDPTQITVRGFGPQFNETLYDGRQVPTAIGNVTRGFDFGSIGSEFVSQVDVLKTPDATLSSGAIGATVNIKYPKPFDHPGMQLAGSLSGTDVTGDNKITPNGSLLFSDTFADDRFGILADVGYSDTKVRANHINIQGWEGGNPAAGGGLVPCQLKGQTCAVPPGSATSPPPSINDWFIQDYGIYQEHNDDKRVGGRFVLQARPVDGLEMTLDDNYAKETLVQLQQGFSAWFNNTGLTNVVQAPDGTVTSFAQPGTPTDFQAQINQSVTTTNTLGFNVKWDATAHTSYMFDAYNAVAKLNPGGQASLDADVGYGNGPNATSLGIVVPGGGNNLPYPTGFGPGGDAANFANPAYIGSHVLVESYNQNTDEINQLKLEGSWHNDQLKFKYGVQFTRDAETLRAFTDLPYTWQMYAGYGPPPVRHRRRRTDTRGLDLQHVQHRLGFHQRLGQRRQPAAEHRCGQRLCDIELSAGFERRGDEHHRVQQLGRRHAVHRQVHHVPESRRVPGRYREYGIAVFEHVVERKDRGHAIEDQLRGAPRVHARDLGRHLQLAGGSAHHRADRPYRLLVHSQPADPDQHREQLPLSVAELGSGLVCDG